MKDVLLLVAVAYAAAALLLPISAIEVLGVALVVACAYFGGLRGGIAAAAWAALVATVAFLLLPGAAPAGYVLSVAAYLLVGLGLGWGVGRFAEQRRRLQEVAERAEAAQRQLAASQKRYRLLFESSNDAVYLHGLDADGEPTRFVAVNDAACSRLGYTREEMLGLTVRAIDVPETPGQIRRIMERLLREDRIVYEAVRKTRDGRRIPVEVSSSLTDVDGELLVLSISRDISGRKKAERRLEHLSMHDDLTGLTNRRGFYVLLPEQGKRSKRSGERLFVLYADIDGFKAINDSLGHKRGDDVLVGIAAALRGTFRETDLVARLGGDEFCVVAEADKDPAALTDRLESALAALSRRLDLEVTLSYGVLSTDWAGLDDPDELLTRADMLMYEAKRAKKGERSAGPARGAASA